MYTYPYSGPALYLARGRVEDGDEVYIQRSEDTNLIPQALAPVGEGQTRRKLLLLRNRNSYRVPVSVVP